MVAVASSSAARTPLVESELTVSDKEISSLGEPSMTAPFTDVLIKATSTVLQEGLVKSETLDKLDKKGELTKAIAIKNSKEDQPKSVSKKSVAIDVPILPIPTLPIPTLPIPSIPIPNIQIVVPPVPLARTESTPAAAFAIARLEKEPTPKQSAIDSVTTIDVQDSKISPKEMSIEVAEHPGIEHVEARGTGPSAPTTAPKEVASEAAASPHETSAMIAKPANPPRDHIVVPAIHVAALAATGAVMETKPTPAREPSIRVISKPTAAPGEHVSSVHTNSAPDVPPVWPAQTPVVASPMNSASAPLHIAQSSPHSLDVGALAGAISRPLVEARDGYTVMIAMHPLELGHLQAVVTLHGSDLHVVITPQTQMGHDALTHAVDTLKTELTRGGVNVNVTLQDPGSQSRGGDRPHVVTVAREVFAREDSLAIAPSVPSLSTNQINLVL